LILKESKNQFWHINTVLKKYGKIKELEETLGYFMKTVYSLRFVNEPELLVL